MAKTELNDTEFIILYLLLSYGEMAGLDITEQSDGYIKLGTVYVTLHRMQDRGLVTSRHEENPQSETRIPKRFYMATALGEEKWKERQPVVSGMQKFTKLKEA